MRCQRCSQPLDGLPEPRCPECGRGFDPNDSTTFTRCLQDPVRVAWGIHRIPATELQEVLESEGIPALCESDSVAIVPVGNDAIWIDRCDLERAQPLITKFLRTRRQP